MVDSYDLQVIKHWYDLISFTIDSTEPPAQHLLPLPLPRSSPNPVAPTRLKFPVQGSQWLALQSCPNCHRRWQSWREASWPLTWLVCIWLKNAQDISTSYRFYRTYCRFQCCLLFCLSPPYIIVSWRQCCKGTVHSLFHWSGLAGCQLARLHPSQIWLLVCIDHSLQREWDPQEASPHRGKVEHRELPG